MRGRARLAVLTLLLVGVGSAVAVAQEGGSTLPREVTLEDVLRLLDTRSPRTIADRASIAVVAADRITAKTLPNPTVSYGGAHLVQGLSTGAVTQHLFSLDQPFLFFGQRQARLESADADVHAEEARVAEQLAARRVAVRQAFATLQSKQDQLVIVKESLADLDRVAQVVRGRAAAGDRSAYDVLRIETETQSLLVQSMNASTDVDDASGQLAALLGISGWLPRAVGPLAAGPTSTDIDVLWTTAQERRPSLVARRQEQTSARGGLLLARRERLPVPSLNGGAQLTQDVNGTSVTFGVSIPLNLFDRNQGAIARAAARIEQADLALQASMAEARAELEHDALVLRQRREALTAFERTVIARLPTLRQMAEDAYREGSADILDLIDVNRSLRELQLSRVQQLEAVKLAEEAVIGASGLDATTP